MVPKTAKNNSFLMVDSFGIGFKIKLSNKDKGGRV
jgi:hypothetical protein